MAVQKRGIRKLEKGNPFNKENRVESKLIEGDLRTRTIYRILDYYKEGMMKYAIINLLREEGDYSDEMVSELIRESTNIVYEQFSTQTQDVIGLHLMRYDKQINSLLNKDYNKVALKIRFKVQTQAYYDALDTLFQKEKLLNLHDKRTIVRFNQRNNVNIVPEKKDKFDLSVLTLEQKIDFLKLVDKCSPKNNINTGVILRERIAVEEETIEIEHEEILNIDQIKHENVVGIDVIPTKPALTMFDLQEKLRKSLQKVAQDALKEAGSTTVEYERKL